jgi:uncharacterized protein
VGPLLTLKTHQALRAALRAEERIAHCSLDLGRSQTTVEVSAAGWAWNGRRFPFLDTCRDRTVYHWSGERFEPVSRFTTALIKLVPTEWGPPTFEIDGIKMLPTAHLSPYTDAQRKVALIEPHGKVILDTCAGLGYFAAGALEQGAARVLSCEKNPDVLWLRGLNPWSPQPCEALTLVHADLVEHIGTLPDGSMDALLHDPPRFGIAGELYAQALYHEFARVLKRKGRLFHYTGTPNKLSSGRDVANEVKNRLQAAGFAVQLQGDGVLAVNQRVWKRSQPP